MVLLLRLGVTAAGATPYPSPAGGTRDVTGPVLDRWLALGGPTGPLGAPLTGTVATPDGLGRYAHSQGGSVYWSAGTGGARGHRRRGGPLGRDRLAERSAGPADVRRLPGHRWQRAGLPGRPAHLHRRRHGDQHRPPAGRRPAGHPGGHGGGAVGRFDHRDADRLAAG
ncbi:hypothetical protein GCU67_19980 [Modestobacter muralis]|uniref:Uncharacterized protein n=1 Tax=Modestobacter muralis TaxID=1608614 RepID=A0A6P0EZ29_9ACTN|nr:hypothetical protein [Modestobacter muralis]NEN53327.1 hypothetical protein [Modestobacter muralis]